MDRHLKAEQVQGAADGELNLDRHVDECAPCANAVLAALRLKSVVRDAMWVEAAPVSLRKRVLPAKRAYAPWWIAAAAAILAVAISAAIVTHERSLTARAELTDLHVTLLAGANPADVMSADRHTIKPWFEGRLPFAVPIPDFSSTPFRLIGGRVVYWRGDPAGCLLVGKGAHRISVFVFREDHAPDVGSGMWGGVSTVSWREAGVTLVAIGGVPRDDLQQLRSSFGRGH